MLPEVQRAIAKLPHHMQQDAYDYLEHGTPPGSFMRAVLENNLHGAAMRADNDNARALFQWAQFLNEIPSITWGSKEKVDRWIGWHKDKKHQEEKGMI